MNYKIAPDTWNESDINPFSHDGHYYGWSLVKLDTTINGFIMGRSSCGCYSVTFNPLNSDFNERIIDFVCYETAHERCVLISSPTYDFDKNILQNDLIQQVNIRQSDPRWLVHSTTLALYEKIIESGFLKSATTLNKEGIKTVAIGFAPLGEPEDYLEHVMFAF